MHERVETMTVEILRLSVNRMRGAIVALRFVHFEVFVV